MASRFNLSLQVYSAPETVLVTCISKPIRPDNGLSSVRTDIGHTSSKGSIIRLAASYPVSNVNLE